MSEKISLDSSDLKGLNYVIHIDKEKNVNT